MLLNKFLINEDKTKVRIIGTKDELWKVNNISKNLQFYNKMNLSPIIIYHEVQFDQRLSFKSHVKASDNSSK